MDPGYQVGFYGPGQMGEALIKFILSKNYHKDQVKFFHPRPDRVEYLTQTYGIGFLPINQIAHVDLLFLCTKPSSAKLIVDNLSLPETTLLVSILAGVPVEFFPYQRVCRAMMSILISDNSNNVYVYGDENWGPLSNTFNLISYNSDDQIDLAMSAFCCGPAFVSKFYQSYLVTVRKMFPNVDDRLTYDLFQSTILTLEHILPEKLIRDVACPNGATERAMMIMNSQLEPILQQTLNSAYKKGVEIRKEHRS